MSKGPCGHNDKMPASTNSLLIIAHAPLASALRECVLHVFPDAAREVAALDIQAHVPPEESLSNARIALSGLSSNSALVAVDMFGATPCNVAQKLVDGGQYKLIAGVNLPMLLRAMTYRHEPLDVMVSRALAGGAQGVMPVATVAPQKQTRKSHDSDSHQHQQ